jgi:DNA-binding GntR family transcriptional regulator
MQDLFEVCQGLEALAGELACERLSKQDVNVIAELHKGMVGHYRGGDLAQYYRCNRLIHEAIVAGAANPVLSNLHESISARIRRARYVTPMTPERWAQALQEHEGILNSLLRGDTRARSHPAVAFAAPARRGHASRFCS